MAPWPEPWPERAHQASRSPACPALVGAAIDRSLRSYRLFDPRGGPSQRGIEMPAEPVKRIILRGPRLGAGQKRKFVAGPGQWRAKVGGAKSMAARRLGSMEHAHGDQNRPPA